MIFTIVTVRGMITFLVIEWEERLGLLWMVYLAENLHCFSELAHFHRLFSHTTFTALCCYISIQRYWFGADFPFDRHPQKACITKMAITVHFLLPLYHSSSISKDFGNESNDNFLSAQGTTRARRTRPVPVPGWGR